MKDTILDSEDRRSLPPEAFLSVLLHELRNPIAVITGWLGILANDEAKAHHSVAIQIIWQKIAILQRLQHELTEYVSEHSPKPEP